MAKSFKGKAIYNPSGKAQEFSYWACNYFVGCSNQCSYCYCKQGVLNKVLGGDKPTLKKCFKDQQQAFEIFCKEMEQNKAELQKHGLFFSFTSDPFLPETIILTWASVIECVNNKIPVKILTKRADFIDNMKLALMYLTKEQESLISFGFTLTGCDELEPFASPNIERIKAMRELHDKGLKTFASIEPIIDIKKSANMLHLTKGYCDLYKVGILKGAKYNLNDLEWLWTSFVVSCNCSNSKVYFKDSLLKMINMDRAKMMELGHRSTVNRDYNMFQ